MPKNVLKENISLVKWSILIVVIYFSTLIYGISLLGFQTEFSLISKELRRQNDVNEVNLKSWITKKQKLNKEILIKITNKTYTDFMNHKHLYSDDSVIIGGFKN